MGKLRSYVVEIAPVVSVTSTNHEKEVGVVIEKDIGKPELGSDQRLVVNHLLIFIAKECMPKLVLILVADH
jgi:hypothetical protein